METSSKEPRYPPLANYNLVQIANLCQIFTIARRCEEAIVAWRNLECNEPSVSLQRWSNGLAMEMVFAIFLLQWKMLIWLRKRKHWMRFGDEASYLLSPTTTDWVFIFLRSSLICKVQRWSLPHCGRSLWWTSISRLLLRNCPFPMCKIQSWRGWCHLFIFPNYLLSTFPWPALWKYILAISPLISGGYFLKMGW